MTASCSSRQRTSATTCWPGESSQKTRSSMLRSRRSTSADATAISRSSAARRGDISSNRLGHWDPQSVAMLQSEAACYWLARHDDAFAGLAALTPEFHAYDVARHVLITGLLADSENLYQHFRRARRFTPDVSRALGDKLGTYHRATGADCSDSQHHAMFQTNPLDSVVGETQFSPLQGAEPSHLGLVRPGRGPGRASACAG